MEIDLPTLLNSINSFNFRDVEDYLNKNNQAFKREETKRLNDACREHIKAHNIDVGYWFNYSYTIKDHLGNDIVQMYELQVVKVNRSWVKATGYMILPKHMKLEYPISVPILSVKP